VLCSVGIIPGAWQLLPPKFWAVEKSLLSILCLKMPNLPKNLFWVNLEAKLKFWVLVISSVSNFQLSVRKLQLAVPPTFLTHEAAGRTYRVTLWWMLVQILPGHARCDRGLWRKSDRFVCQHQEMAAGDWQPLQWCSCPESPWSVLLSLCFSLIPCLHHEAHSSSTTQVFSERLLSVHQAAWSV